MLERQTHRPPRIGRSDSAAEIRKGVAPGRPSNDDQTEWNHEELEHERRAERGQKRRAARATDHGWNVVGAGWSPRTLARARAASSSAFLNCRPLFVAAATTRTV